MSNTPQTAVRYIIEHDPKTGLWEYVVESKDKNGVKHTSRQIVYSITVEGSVIYDGVGIMLISSTGKILFENE